MPVSTRSKRPDPDPAQQLAELAQRETAIVAEREAMERLLAAIRETSSHRDLSQAWAAAARGWRRELEALDTQRQRLAANLSERSARALFKEVERKLTLTREHLRLTDNLLLTIRSEADGEAELSMNEAWQARSRELRVRLEWIRQQRRRLLLQVETGQG